MKAILSAKNKARGKAAIFFFGLVVFITMLIRVFRSGAKKPAEYISVAKGELKDLTRLQTLLMLLGSVATLGLIGLEMATVGTPGISTAVLVGVLTTGAGVVTTFNLTYVPKFIHYVAATQLTGFKMTVQGDGVIFDSDAAGLNSAGVLRLQGQVTNGFLITLANGFIPGKNVILEFTNSAAQTPSIFASSDESAASPMYLQLLRQAVLANSGQNFSDFATLALPSLGANDIVNILYNDGTQQQFNRAELQAYLTFTQNVNANLYTIDNFAGRIKLVNVIAGTAQTAYVQRWVSAVPNGMVNGSVNN